jgi:hypothetical protein
MRLSGSCAHFRAGDVRPQSISHAVEEALSDVLQAVDALLAMS